VSIEIEPGVFLGQATRNCKVPAGKALFFPIVNYECSTLEGNGTTYQQLKDCAAFFADFIDPDSLKLTIDGKSIQNLDNYRVQSPLFAFGPRPDKNIFQFFGLNAPPGTTSQSVSDGVHVMDHPLAKGKHKIQFYGELDLSPIGGPLFIQDITYTITVGG